MSNDDYQKSPGISKSMLDDIAEPSCPLHFWAKHIDPDRAPEERTPALILGDAIHKAILEPDLVSQHFVEIPEEAPKKPSIAQVNAKSPSIESVGAINYWRDFRAENEGKAILKPEEMKLVLACRDAIHRHPVARGLFSGGRAEQSYFAIDPETGAVIKCRLDYDRLETEGMIVDLKTTEDASPAGFGHSATKYRYDVQGVWYPDVLHAAYGQTFVQQFVFVAVEKNYPHAIGVYYLDPSDIPPAREAARRDKNLIVQCQSAGHWPDFGEDPQALSINKFRRRPA
jgi:hypothetical protein